MSITQESINLFANNAGNLDAEQRRLLSSGLRFATAMNKAIQNRTEHTIPLTNCPVAIIGTVINIDFEDGSGWNFVLDVQHKDGSKYHIFVTARTQTYTLVKKY